MVDYHPFSQAVIDDPHSIYARLREEAPCFYIEDWDTFALSRFEDIWSASMDATNYSTAKGSTTSQLITKVQPVTPMINVMDPPKHTALRSQIAPFFTPGAVRRLEPEIEKIVDEAFASVRDASRTDVFNDFAVRTDVVGDGFSALYENYLETQVATVGLRWRL